MLDLIFNDIFVAFIQYVPYAITAGVIAITAVFVLLLIITEEEAAILWDAYKLKLTLLYFTFVYLFGVVAVTFLSREPGSRDGIYLRPFSTFFRSSMDHVYSIENIILFIPMGLLLPFLWKKFRHFISCTLFGILFSLAIEVSQLLTKRGFFQIDDILTNMVGCAMGFGLSSLIRAVIYIGGRCRKQRLS
jgi:glycopeptide antibiotics resistance protein